MKYSIRNFFLVFLMSIVIFSVIAVFVVRYADGVMQSTLVNKDENGPDGAVQDLTSEDPSNSNQVKSGDTVTFLISGTDEMDGWADALLLVRIDRETSLFTTVMIPANTRLFVGGSDRAIGSLITLDSPRFLKQKVGAITGIEVDYQVNFDLQGFADLIDLVGGVDFSVPENMRYRDDEQALRIDISSGLQHVDGAKAAQLIRYRGYVDGVSGRNETILSFTEAFANQILKTDNMFRAQTLITQIFETIDTDMSVSDFISAMPLIFSYDSFQHESFTYPGRYVYESGVEWFVPSFDNAFTVFEIYRESEKTK
ncbi:MAG: LCP family protein [Clostridia bacterium]|nr:LCP family protein [Clostridia bacterium]